MASFHRATLLYLTFLFSALSGRGGYGDELPPAALQQLASPLPDATSHLLLHHLNAGGEPAMAAPQQLCSAAELYCPSKDIYPSPRVCIPPFFHYEYGIIPCEFSSSSLQASSPSQASLMFFKRQALAKQSTITLPDLTNTLNGRHFLPEELAEALPLQEGSLGKLSRLLNISTDSGMYESMVQTVHSCSSSPAAGEQKRCVSSVGSMLKLARASLGSQAQLVAPSAAVQGGYEEEEAKVVSVEGVGRDEEGDGGRVMACHSMMFPWLVYSCHVSSRVEVLRVVLIGKASSALLHELLVVCHMDTKGWNPSHVSFRVLHVKPGEGEVCHWVPENTFLWKKY